MVSIKLIVDAAIKCLSVLWKKIVKWIIPIVKNALVEGVKYLIKKTSDVILQKLNEYEKKGNQWYVTETTKVIADDEIPEEIKNKVGSAPLNHEVDCSDELEEQLELAQ